MASLVNIFKANLRNALLAESPITAEVDTRIYGAHLSTLFDVSYPALTFTMHVGNVQHFGLLRDFPITMAAHSLISFHEARSILGTVWDFLNVNCLLSNITIRVQSNVRQMFDDSVRGTNLYNAFQFYRVQQIGKEV